MPATKIYKCGICKNSVGKSQGGIQCSTCKSWLHLTCANVSEKHLLLFNERPNSFSFSCANCSNNGANDDSVRDDIRSLKESFENFVKTSRDDHDVFKNDITKMLSDFKHEVSTCIKEMKEDIVSCSKLIDNIDSSTTAKFSALEFENNILHRRLNRGDIIISGLPAGLNDLTSAVVSLCSFYEVNATSRDFHLVCYINKKGKILVKFNNVEVRDTIMRAYFKTRTLKVNDVIGGELDSRVYLNEHYSPATANLNFMCHKLLRQKIILKYRILNGDKPKAKLTLIDGKEVVSDISECAALFNRNAGSS